MRVTVVQINLVVAAQKPRLAPYIEQIRSLIAAVLNIPTTAVGQSYNNRGLGLWAGRRNSLWAVATVQNKETLSLKERV